MKYICLGYYDEKKWETMSETERNAMMDECFTYDDVLRRNGHFAGGEALQSARNATTMRWQNGKVSFTDGPYAETKEQLGGILVLDAKDLNHAIQLMSKHPGVKAGPFEIRPAEDLTEMIRESERRRATTNTGRRSAILAGHHTVTPYLAIKNAVEALEFYKKAFGATESFRLMMPDGRLGHAEIRLGDSVIMVSDEFPEYGGKAPETLGGSPVSIHLYVEDVDAFFKKALAAGAKERKPVMDQFYGDRSGQLEDPFGHLWWVATHKEDIAPEEMQKRVRAMFAGKK